MAQILMRLNVSREDFAWLAVASLGLALCLMLNGGYDSTVSDRVSCVTFGGVITSDPLSGGISIIAICALATLVLGLHRREPRLSVPVAALFSAVLAIPLAVMLFSSSTLAANIGGLVLSAAGILLLGFWVQALARAGRGRAFLVLAIALVLATLINALVDIAFIEFAGNIVLIIIALIAPFILFAFEHMDGPCKVAPLSSNASASTTALSAKPPQLGRLGLPLARSAYDIPFWLAMAFIALESLAMGHVQALGYEVELTGAREWIYENSIPLCVIVIALFSLVCAHLREPHAILRAIILVVLMFSVYLSGSVGDQMEPVGRLSMTTVRLLITLYLWLLACDIPWRNGWPMYAFVAGWGTFTLMNTVSTKIGSALAPGSTGRMAYDLAIVGCLAALVVMELIAQRVYADGLAGIPGANSVGEAIVLPTDVEQANPTATAANEEMPAPEDPLVAPCQALAQKYSLTARELDVLIPLVHGRSAATIGQMLGMSTETARTHIRHIYSKTDIHNREDLMDEVENQGEA